MSLSSISQYEDPPTKSLEEMLQSGPALHLTTYTIPFIELALTPNPGTVTPLVVKPETVQDAIVEPVSRAIEISKERGAPIEREVLAVIDACRRNPSLRDYMGKIEQLASKL